MNYTARQMIEALDLVTMHDPVWGDRFAAIGLSNMNSETADLMMSFARDYGYAL